MSSRPLLEVLTERPERTGIFTDFDGTLSEIVDRPEDARAVDGAGEVLEDLARRFAVVAVVSGRSLDDLRSRIAPAGVVLSASYGRERSDRPSRHSPEQWETVAVAAASMIGGLPGVFIERKGAGVALHFRGAPDREAEVRRSADALAQEFKLDVLPGRMVVEVVRPGPTKGDALASLASDHGLSALAFAGDDVADLEAFAWARSAKLRSVLVAVASEESPPELASSADLVVSGPKELVVLLGQLTPR